MHKNAFLTGALALSLGLPGATAFAQGSPESSQSQQGGQSSQKPSKTEKTALQARADLHERIAKAHKNAAQCLKGGKRPESECSEQLKKECQATGATESCMAKSEGSMAGQAGSEDSSTSSSDQQSSDQQSYSQ